MTRGGSDRRVHRGSSAQRWRFFGWWTYAKVVVTADEVAVRSLASLPAALNREERGAVVALTNWEGTGIRIRNADGALSDAACFPWRTRATLETLREFDWPVELLDAN